MTEACIADSIGTALIVSRDEAETRLLTQTLDELALRIEICTTTSGAVDWVHHHKIETAIIDLSEFGTSFIDQIRISSSNRRVVTLAITDDASETARALKTGSTFALERPLTYQSVRNTFRAAYGLIVRERGRYYRHPVAVSAVLSAKGHEEILGWTVNLSETGMAFYCSSNSLALGTVMTAQFQLGPPQLLIAAESKVRWVDDKGRAGLSFLSGTFPGKPALHAWLAQKFGDQLPATFSRRVRQN